MIKTFTLLFFLKKGKLQSDGTVPIYLKSQKSIDINTSAKYIQESEKGRKRMRG